ncbi:hypothetical protein ACFQ4O_03915 [Methylopila musalis]|uniref:Uncharacterized protein n=1 Tax=Methylopila musalis TaxID=1134781 RepID=A0ABW3Z5L3_9HYPH
MFHVAETVGVTPARLRAAFPLLERITLAKRACAAVLHDKPKGTAVAEA